MLGTLIHAKATVLNKIENSSGGGEKKISTGINKMSSDSDKRYVENKTW